MTIVTKAEMEQFVKHVETATALLRSRFDALVDDTEVLCAHLYEAFKDVKWTADRGRNFLDIRRHHLRYEHNIEKMRDRR